MDGVPEALYPSVDLTQFSRRRPRTFEQGLGEAPRLPFQGAAIIGQGNDDLAFIIRLAHPPRNRKPQGVAAAGSWCRAPAPAPRRCRRACPTDCSPPTRTSSTATCWRSSKDSAGGGWTGTRVPSSCRFAHGLSARRQDRLPVRCPTSGRQGRSLKALSHGSGCSRPPQQGGLGIAPKPVQITAAFRQGHGRPGDPVTGGHGG